MAGEGPHRLVVLSGSPPGIDRGVLDNRPELRSRVLRHWKGEVTDSGRAESADRTDR
ncbi:hypothetical protein FRAHR75_10187 [Frankia sp. Hr75.2]|nr:hypothetical protein FRAHR75_10187 [Frankia sp. Hr75.2]SQD96585.1 hypothetical protein FMEAI12_3650048 [Parafrankia sp. Ea1.12]